MKFLGMKNYWKNGTDRYASRYFPVFCNYRWNYRNTGRGMVPYRPVEKISLNPAGNSVSIFGTGPNTAGINRYSA